MPDKKTRPDERGPRGFVFWLARTIVWLRFAIVPAWIALAVLASSQLPSIFNAETAQLGNLLPHSSESIEVEEKAIEKFGLPLLSRTIVVAADPHGFSARQSARRPATSPPSIARAEQIHPPRGSPGQCSGGPRRKAARDGARRLPLHRSEPQRSRTRSKRLTNSRAGLKRATGAPQVDVTGAVPANASETDLGNEYILWVELATVLLVVGILAFYFRSVGVPALALASVGLAYLLADRVLGWMGERFGLEIPKEAEPVVIALLFGTITDYVVFFVSDYRRRLLDGERSHLAATEATAELLPVILTAALMIAGATLTLLLSGVRFLSAFGPGNGRLGGDRRRGGGHLRSRDAWRSSAARLHWPWKPAEQDPAAGEGDPAAGARGRIVGFAADHPLIVILACLLMFAAAASGLRDMALGNPLIRGLPDSSSPNRATTRRRTASARGSSARRCSCSKNRASGRGRPRSASCNRGSSRAAGVSGAIGPSDEPPQSRYGVLLSPDGDAARFILILDSDPDGSEASEALSGVEEELPGMLEASGLGRGRSRDNRRHDDRHRTDRKHLERPGTGRAGRDRRPRAPALDPPAELGRAALPGRRQPAHRRRGARPDRLCLPGPARLRGARPSSCRWRPRSCCWRWAPTTTSS